MAGVDLEDVKMESVEEKPKLKQRYHLHGYDVALIECASS